MMPFDRLAENQRLQQIRSAIQLFESNSEYPNVMIQISRESDELAKGQSEEARQPGTKERMQYIVKMFDVSAQAYLRLVSTIETQKAYMVVLSGFMREAWERYIGYPFDVAPPIGRAAVSIQERVKHWTIEGYKRLDSLQQAASTQSAEAFSPEQSETLETKREAVILPILDRLGMSKSKWATKAGVDPSVVYDYLAGKSDPRPENRKALAEAIELQSSDLPQ